jgi:CRISPR-associated endonuclease/helicase Cas3
LLRESLDARQIQPLREELRYRDVAAAYHLISEDTIPVIVPYGEAMALLDTWQRDPNRRNWRKLQPYIVSLFQHEVKRYGRNFLAPVDGESDLHYCIRREEYDDLIGLGRLFNDPSDPIYMV